MGLATALLAAVVVGGLVSQGTAPAVAGAAGAVGVLAAGLRVHSRTTAPSDTRAATPAIAAMAAVAAMTMPMSGTRIGPVLISDVLLILPAVGIVLSRCGGRAQPLQKILSVPHIAGLGLLIAGSVIGSLTTSGLTPDTLIVVSKFTVGAVLLTLLMVRWSPDHHARRLLLWGWVAGMAASAVFALATAGGERPAGLSHHPNALGMTAAMTLPMVQRLWETTRRVAERWMLGAAGALTLMALLLSASRSAALGAAVAITLMLWRVAPQRRYAAAGAVVILATATALLAPGAIRSFQSQTMIERLSGGGNAAESLEDRVALLDEAIDRGESNPVLGAGFEFGERPHNIVVEVWASAGALGLAGLAVIVWISCAPSVWARRRHGSTELGELWTFSAAALAFFVVDLFHNALWSRFAWFVIAVQASLYMQLRRSRSRSAQVFDRK